MNAFKRWRTELRLTQEAAARKLGVTGRQVQYYETGQVVPSESVRRLMDVVARGIETEPWPMEQEPEDCDNLPHGH